MLQKIFSMIARRSKIDHIRQVHKKAKSVLKMIIGRAPGSYGQDRIVRRYLNYPNWLPFNAQIQHGWYAAQIHDVKRLGQIEVMLVWSKRIASEWKEISDKNVFIIGAPFVIYKESKEIRQADDAKGTVVFPDHSSPGSFVKFDVESYSKALNNLPPEMKPITVCLHHRDMDYYGPLFSLHGFPVVTAGDSRQRKDGFVKNFYEILRKHKYSSSNEIGSYTFYSIDMNIPFFLYGPLAISVSRQNDNIIYERDNFLIQCRSLFSEITTQISPAQREFVSAETGLYDRADPYAIKSFFLRRFFFYEIPRYPIRLFRHFLLQKENNNNGAAT